jgi:hypothetical protein
MRNSQSSLLLHSRRRIHFGSNLTAPAHLSASIDVSELEVDVSGLGRPSPNKQRKAVRRDPTPPAALRL